jgi:hypothetical protein
MNWRKRKKIWKRTKLWKRNGSNKSMHTWCRVNCKKLPRWREMDHPC